MVPACRGCVREARRGLPCVPSHQPCSTVSNRGSSVRSGADREPLKEASVGAGGTLGARVLGDSWAVAGRADGARHQNLRCVVTVRPDDWPATFGDAVRLRNFDEEWIMAGTRIRSVSVSVGAATLLVGAVSVSAQSTLPAFSASSAQRRSGGGCDDDSGVGEFERRARGRPRSIKPGAGLGGMAGTWRSPRLRRTWCRATPTADATCSCGTKRGVTRRVSVSSSGQPGQQPSASRGDFGGRPVRGVRVVCVEPGGGRHQPHTDVFVRDRKRGVTRRVSVSSSEHQGHRGQLRRARSPRTAGTWRSTRGVEPGGRRHQRHDTDVFVRDRKRGVTRRVSVSSSGRPGQRQLAAGDLRGRPVRGVLLGCVEPGGRRHQPGTTTCSCGTARRG